MKFSVDLPPEEDTNPALTRHAILKRPQASWSQSVFSVPFGNKIMPNRDYPYEGLSVLINGENFHFLEGIAVGVKNEGIYAALAAKQVTVSPWKMSYSYENEAEHFNLTIHYYLMDRGLRHNGVTACISLESNASSVIIEPLVDIRHMYESSAPEEHECGALNDGLVMWRDDKCIALRTANQCEVRTWHKSLEWWYKLGSGFREKTEDGMIFKGEKKNPVSLGELEIPFGDSPVSLVLSCSNSQAELDELHEYGKGWLRDETEEQRRAEEIVHALNIPENDSSRAFRALALAKFGMYVNGAFLYEAGDFWFRTPWFRDMFEGIINNIETFVRIGDSEKIKNSILRSFDYQDNHGRVPNRFPERKSKSVDYNNADATLLAFIAAGELLRRSWDAHFAAAILKKAVFTIERFMQNDLTTINGPPVLNENGLISVVPWHSWTDTKREGEIGRKRVNVPIRVPDSWWKGLTDDNELNKPTYFLPEINAQWIKMLHHCANISDTLGRKEELFTTLLAEAKRNFKTVFWDGGNNRVHNVVTMDGQTDTTLGSPAVVAFSLVADEAIFTHREVLNFIANVKEHLLVEKNGLPFGILVKKSPKKIYYGDEEYHEAVVWPRDTPYLIRLLRYSGAREKKLVKGLLQSNLDHQMNEGFVFYNGELFSPDDGAMHPVKNPIQFWSQWMDPFLEV